MRRLNQFLPWFFLIGACLAIAIGIDESPAKLHQVEVTRPDGTELKEFEYFHLAEGEDIEERQEVDRRTGANNRCYLPYSAEQWGDLEIDNDLQASL